MRLFLSGLMCLVLSCAAFAQEPDWRDSLTPQDEIAFPALSDADQAENALPVADHTPLQSLESADPISVPESVLSTIEAMYAERVMDEPKQFGYDIFTDSDQSETTPVGVVQDDYVLGVGDDVSIAFSGQRNTRETLRVDTQGMVSVQDFAPITAAGLTLAQLRAALEERASGLHNTQVYVTLAGLRQIGVLVVGNVNKPGRKNLTSFNTVLDALIQAGGVKKDGSLRQIKLVRGGQGRLVDLYSLLLQDGRGMDMTLRDGDRIVVPPIGATVAVSGAVKRPGIYEIRTDPFKGLMGKNDNKLSLRQMLQLGGGVLGAGQNRFTHLSVRENGYEVVQEVASPTDRLFKDASILVVSRGKDLRAAQTELLGETRKPGLYALAEKKSLSDVLSGPQVLGEDIYPLIGVIARWDAERLATRFLDYPVRAVLKNEKEVTLKDGDKIYLFSNTDIQKIFSDQKNGSSGIDNKNTDGNFGDENAKIFDENPALVSYLKERVVAVRGAVRQPGLYPVAQDITLDDVLGAVGGLGRDADRRNIEITATKSSDEADVSKPRQTIDLSTVNAKDVPVKPGDAIRVMEKFRQMEENGVLIAGEVKNPGRYDLLPEDKVSDLIRRAGGLNPQSFPYGAVFTRESERRAEEARYRSAKQDMERSLAAALQRDKNRPDTAQIDMVKGLADELGTAKGLGRITIEADPAVLQMKPELDMLLQVGDKLYIPKRPLTVRVSGEVLSPAALQFVSAKDPREYIQQAGGFTYHADKDRTFVLFPDGSAQPLRVNTWNHKAIMIPPGSTIIVPRDPKPFDFIESARDVTQILSNLAVTSILVDDLQE